MAVVFDKCCCCIDLRTGCFIIGYLNLIAEIIGEILLIIGFVAAGAITAQGDEKHQEMGVMLLVIFGLTILFLTLHLVFTVVLLVGLHKDKPGHVKAYLIFSTVFMVLYVLKMLTNFSNIQLLYPQLIQDLISIAFGIYFLLVIRSQYFEMKNGSKGPAVYTTA